MCTVSQLATLYTELDSPGPRVPECIPGHPGLWRHFRSNQSMLGRIGGLKRLPKNSLRQFQFPNFVFLTLGIMDLPRGFAGTSTGALIVIALVLLFWYPHHCRQFIDVVFAEEFPLQWQVSLVGGGFSKAWPSAAQIQRIGFNRPISICS